MTYLFKDKIDAFREEARAEGREEDVRKDARKESRSLAVNSGTSWWRWPFAASAPRKVGRCRARRRNRDVRSLLPLGPLANDVLDVEA